jgi:ubiquitin-conjugating enzyme E2 M
LNILKLEWSPVFNLPVVIGGLYVIFELPNPEDPFNEDAAKMMNEDLSKFEQFVKEILKGGLVNGINFPKFL